MQGVEPTLWWREICILYPVHFKQCYFISVIYSTFSFIGVDIVMCCALICVKEIDQSLMSAKGLRVASGF